MTSIAAAIPASSPHESPLQMGRSFIHPLFDYMLIGGGLSLLFVGGLALNGRALHLQLLSVTPPLLILLSNSAHFAASTVRLYTKPGAFKDLPFLTMAFPLVTIAVVTLSILFADVLGRHLNALYFTWSPFHYAAQAYGLSVMYCYRSNCRLELNDKRLLRWTCMAPFLWAFMRGSNSGLGWFVPGRIISEHASLLLTHQIITRGLEVASFLLPPLLFFRLRWSRGLTMPLICLLLMVSNGIWWVLYTYMDAFTWATVFHGIQYLAIVAIFHVKDQTRLAGNRHGRLYHTLAFYAMCVALGYLLFSVWPRAYVLAGFSLSQSMLLVAAVINIHHFIVDGYIWKLRKDPNYAIVTDTARVSV